MRKQSIRGSRKSDDLEALPVRDEFVGYHGRGGHENAEDWSTNEKLAQTSNREIVEVGPLHQI